MIFYRGGQAIIDIQISYHRDIQGCDKRDWASPKEVLLRYSSIHLAIRIHPGDPESDIDHRSDRSQCIESRARVFRVSGFAEGGLLSMNHRHFPFFSRRRRSDDPGWSGTDARSWDARDKTDETCVRGFVGRASSRVTIGSTPLSCTLPLVVVPLPLPPRHRCGLVTPTSPCLRRLPRSRCSRCLFLSPLFLAHREQGSSRTTRPSVESSRKGEREEKEGEREACTRIAV